MWDWVLLKSKRRRYFNMKMSNMLTVVVDRWTYILAMKLYRTEKYPHTNECKHIQGDLNKMDRCCQGPYPCSSIVLYCCKTWRLKECMRISQCYLYQLCVPLQLHKKIQLNIRHQQPKCPSKGEWINKLVIHTVAYHLVIKRNELSNHKRAWRNLKCILLNGGETPIWRGYVLYDSKWMTFWKKQNYGDCKKKKISACQD